MEEKMSVNLDYETLVAKSLHAWDNIANYRPEIILSIPGDTKLKIVDVLIGELGTVEIMKENDGCIVNFSDVTLIEDYEKKVEQEFVKAEGNILDKILRASKVFRDEMPENGLLQAKQEQWQETKNIYKLMIKNIQPSRKHGKSGRPDLKEDTWAWKQVFEQKRDMNEVYQEWRKKAEERNLVDPERQFKKIMSDDWITPKMTK